MPGARGGAGARLPVALSVTAVVIAAVGVTPAGQAASQTVRAALFASDAGSVNGMRVSRKPRAGRLLALDRDGRFPRAVIPPTEGVVGPAGAQGPRGQQGDPGHAGGSLYFTRSTTGKAVSRFQDERTTVAELRDLPSGSWLLLAQLSAGGVGNARDMRCAIVRRNVVVGPARSTVGRGAGGMRVTGMLALAPWTASEPSTPRLDCGMDSETTGEPGVEYVLLGAIRVGSLEVRRQQP